MQTLILLKAALFIVLFIGDVVSANSNDICPPETTQVVKFYDFEMMVASKATFCFHFDQPEVSEILSRLLYDALRNIPGLVSATASICSNAVGFNRRALEGNTTKESALDDALDMQRRLRQIFIYRGDMRCSFCLWDDFDFRRILDSEDEECRQSKTTISDQINAEDWKNGKILKFKHRDNIALGKYTNGDTFSRKIVVPPGTTALEISFRVLHHHVGKEWGSKEVIQVSANGETLSLRKPKNTRFYQQKDWLSGELRWPSKGGFYRTKVAIHIDLERGGLFDPDNETEIELSFHIKTSSPKKRVALHQIIIKALRTCSAPYLAQKILERGHLLSLEKRIELYLSKTITPKFRRIIENNNGPCFAGKDPTIHVNLYERESFKDAPRQQC